MKFSKLIHYLSLAILLCMWVYIGINFTNLPDEVPTHFDLKGQVDGYGAKQSILLVPFIATLLYLLIFYAGSNKSNLNYPIIITDKNREKAYALTDNFIALLRLMLVVVFATIAYVTCQTAFGNVKSTSIVLVECGFILFLVLGYIFKLTSLKREMK